MNILLLGGTGFIGRQMVEKLVNKGYNVSLVVHKSIPDNFKEIKDKITLYKGDILDRNSIKDAFCNQDIVVNLVGQICDNKNLFAKSRPFLVEKASTFITRMCKSISDLNKTSNFRCCFWLMTACHKTIFF